MSGYPPPPPSGPPYWPHPHPPPPSGPYPEYGHGPPPYWVPGAIMMPVPMPPMPPTHPPHPESQPTYITNYYYGGEAAQTSPEPVQVVESSGELDWVPSTSTTAHMLQGRAVVGGHEGWDGSPLWVIRAWHNGDLIPGKLSIRHYAASVMYDGKEVPVQNIEVLCMPSDNLRWVPASNGMVPPGAVRGGNTANGETLYVGRANYQLSLTPGKVHPSHRACYIGFAGREVAQKVYDVLCRV